MQCVAVAPAVRWKMTSIRWVPHKQSVLNSKWFKSELMVADWEGGYICANKTIFFPSPAVLVRLPSSANKKQVGVCIHIVIAPRTNDVPTGS